MSKYGKYFKTTLNEDGVSAMPSTNTSNVANPTAVIGTTRKELPNAKSYKEVNAVKQKKTLKILKQKL